MIKFVKLYGPIVGSADPINGILYLKTTNTSVLLHEAACALHLRKRVLAGAAFWEASNYGHHSTLT